MEKLAGGKFNPESKEGQPISKIVVTTANTTIDLHDIISLLEKLGPSGKQNFLHQLSQEKNLSENVSNLLVKLADSQILNNLCAKTEIAGDLLEKIVQKLLGIVKGTEKVVAIISPEEEEYYQEDDESEESVVPNELLVKDIAIFLEILFKNPNLTSDHIESLMKVFSGSMNYWFRANLCSHVNTPSSILEQIYEMDPSNMQDIILQHPNLLGDFKAMIERVIQQKEEKNKVNEAIDAIVEKHPSLDIDQILHYYENKQDEPTCKIIAEYLYQKDLGSYRYGAKERYEHLKLKLQLIQKYNLGEDHTLRILYDMIGDNIVNRGVLEAYAEAADDYTYLNISEVEKKYGVVIDHEHIKGVCQEILEEAKGWCTPNIEDIRNVYKFAKKLNIEFSDDFLKFYVNKLVDVIKNRYHHGYSFEKNLISKYFDDALELMQIHKNLFSEGELKQYVRSMDVKRSLPKSGICDIFEIIEKLGLSGQFAHQIALEHIEKYYLTGGHFEVGKELVKKFTITEDELINLFIKTDWYFVQPTEHSNSLEQCLAIYGITVDKVIPSLLQKMKNQVINQIQRKDYTDAQTIITKYNLSDNPDFQEEVELLNTLLKK